MRTPSPTGIIHWRGLSILFLILIFSFTTVCFANSYDADLYSEQVYLTREQVGVSSIRVRTGMQWTAELRPFLEMGNEMGITQGTIGNFDSQSSFAYAGPGLSLKLGRQWTVYAGLRARKFYQESDPNEEGLGTWDARALLVYGDFFSYRIATTVFTDLFAELYSESVFTSADEANVVLTNFARLGVRVSPATNTYLDFFLETYATLDRLGHYYYNHADLRPSLRIQYASEKFSIGLIASYMASWFYPRASFEINPYQNQPSGSRLLLVLGGTL